jgi:hypothetical protein
MLLTTILLDHTPVWIAVVLIVSVALMLIALFIQTSNISWAIRRIERVELAHPPDADQKEPGNIVKSYAVRADMALAEQSWAPTLSEYMPAVCGGATKVVQCTYNAAYWLPLRKTGQAQALEEEVLAERVRYAYLGGCAVRILSAKSRDDLKQNMPFNAKPDTHVVFVVAPAYDVTLTPDSQSANSQCELAKLTTAQGAAAPAHWAVLPLHTGNADALRQTLTNRASKELHLQLLAYGWVAPSVS